MVRLVVAVTGASGVPLAYRLLETLHNNTKVETYLIISESAELTWSYEMDIALKNLYAMADHVIDNNKLDSCIASGSYPIDGMIICPCSMKTIAGISNGYSESLILRVADVMIKEKKPLILQFRENPLSPIHIRNLTTLSKIASIYLMPMVMTYYNKPKSIQDMEDTLIGRMLDPFQLNYKQYKRWKQ